ncbi:MarR family winged helix-turn-helix transcriptional regulator [Cellulomonas oligotrophica]|uniref:MarR family transcriptional regulator n=1 Tax=Cellulomonas oligotrophica TaxID=931536 RepID=A0A7Y9FHT7_9CELL|nr:MarR family transcriptional regulator [Cellulomonas oligotrophica]NYD87494.1 DNA-binding MarR family transcriptional regulator [Cellulomonas oligotrophica]GIG33372.1 MarR family transcriptional regulator [Cellulomonas oligotrophica]
MNVRRTGIDLDTSLGYALKEAASALRSAMEDALRPLGLGVTQYACLELLDQRPGLSASDLARGVFVTRQTMNVLLQALERDGMVARDADAALGRSLPARLTTRGRAALQDATTAVRAVEVRMLTGLTEAEQTHALQVLTGMASALRAPAPPDPDGA